MKYYRNVLWSPKSSTKPITSSASTPRARAAGGNWCVMDVVARTEIPRGVGRVVNAREYACTAARVRPGQQFYSTEVLSI